MISCSWIGSGVVRLPFRPPPGATRPIVPRLAALCPARSQIWRRKTLTDVLPLVPVTAATVRGCRAKYRADINASARRGSSTRMIGIVYSPGSDWRPVRIAAAPASTACGMNFAPSDLIPGSAAKSMPGPTLRLSAVKRLDPDVAVLRR